MDFMITWSKFASSNISRVKILRVGIYYIPRSETFFSQPATDPYTIFIICTGIGCWLSVTVYCFLLQIYYFATPKAPSKWSWPRQSNSLGVILFQSTFVPVVLLHQCRLYHGTKS
jgi:hypothetical protein